MINKSRPPEVEVAKYCVPAESPFKEVIAPEAVAQSAQDTPLAAVEEAIKQSPLLPTAKIPKVPEPVPVRIPPFWIVEASNPSPP